MTLSGVDFIVGGIEAALDESDSKGETSLNRLTMLATRILALAIYQPSIAKTILNSILDDPRMGGDTPNTPREVIEIRFRHDAEQLSSIWSQAP
jgi:hypothetical protein